MRLTLGTASLLVLLVAPWHEHRRAAEAIRTASAIHLPDPEQPSPAASSEAQRATDRVMRLDLDRALPASAARTDLSDLAYRIWKDGEESGSETPLIAYEVLDGAGRSISSFSLLPQASSQGGLTSSPLTIERHRVAVVQREALLLAGGRPWGTVRIAVADWPAWDPLPARIEVYRRLVLGGSTRLGRAAGDHPRPVLASYTPDGSLLEKGPDLPEAVRAHLPTSASPTLPVHLSFLGEELRGELRAAPEGFELVAVPGPDFFGRLLIASIVLPALGLVALIAAALLAWRLAASPSAERAALVPASARTFRGRLVALFVVGVMIPLVTLTFFLRREIEVRSARDTLDHARTALDTARRVLDSYMLSAAIGRDRLGVARRRASGLAGQRRRLRPVGLWPGRAAAGRVAPRPVLGRASGPARARPGLRRHRPGRTPTSMSGPGPSRPTASRRSRPPSAPCRACPACGARACSRCSCCPSGGWRRRRRRSSTAAVSAFSLLIFVVSAAIAGRLAVRVARPVADLVLATRAVARGDFAPDVPEAPDEELRELVRAFLSMSRSLKDQTDALSLEKERLATLLAHLTAGVVAVGEGGRVLLANPAAAALGGGRTGGDTLEDVFPGEAMRGRAPAPR